MESTELFFVEGRRFFLTDNIEPKPLTETHTYSFISIFEMVYDKELEMDKWVFIDYFAYCDESDEELIKMAKEYIDRYDNGKGKLLKLTKDFRNIWYKYINDDKNFYKVEDAEHELLEVIIDEKVEL